MFQKFAFFFCLSDIVVVARSIVAASRPAARAARGRLKVQLQPQAGGGWRWWGSGDGCRVGDGSVDHACTNRRVAVGGSTRGRSRAQARTAKPLSTTTFPSVNLLYVHVSTVEETSTHTPPTQHNNSNININSTSNTSTTTQQNTVKRGGGREKGDAGRGGEGSVMLTHSLARHKQRLHAPWWGVGSHGCRRESHHRTRREEPKNTSVRLATSTSQGRRRRGDTLQRESIRMEG